MSEKTYAIAIRDVMAEEMRRDDNPVMFFEHKALYATKGEVPDDPNFMIPFGKADIKRAGTDVTIIANLLYVSRALEAAEILIQINSYSTPEFATDPVYTVHSADVCEQDQQSHPW